MRKLNNLSILGIFVGAVIFISSIAHWYVQYTDYSQLFFGASIGLIIIIFSFIYNWMQNVGNNIKKIEDRTDAVVDWFMERQKEAVLDRAKGIEHE